MEDCGAVHIRIILQRVFDHLKVGQVLELVSLFAEVTPSNLVDETKVFPLILI